MNVGIVGGGIMGTLSGLALLKQGADVQMIDDERVGASHGQRLAGVFWQNKVLRNLMKEGTDWWDTWLGNNTSKDSMQPYSLRRDMYEVFKDDDARQAVRTVLDEFGVEYVLQESHPLLKCSNPAIFYPQAARLIFVDRVLPVLKREFVSRNGVILTATVEEISENGEVKLTGQTKQYDHVVLSNGAWVQNFSEIFGVSVTATRQNWYQAFEEMGCKGLSASDMPYVKDMRNARRILPDENCIRVFDGTVGAVIKPGAEENDSDELGRLKVYLSDFFPEISYRLEHHKCQYVCTPDYGPLVDRKGHISILSPPAGGGVKTGPALANACAQLVLTGSNPLPQFDAKRFTKG